MNKDDVMVIEDFEMERIDCPNCGMITFFPENFICLRRNDGKTFKCPVGHDVCFPKGDTVEKLKSRIVDLEKDIETLKTEKLNLIHKLEQSGKI